MNGVTAGLLREHPVRSRFTGGAQECRARQHPALTARGARSYALRMPTPIQRPWSRAVDVNDPLAALRAFEGLPHAFLLEASVPGTNKRWSLFGADPFAVHRGGDWDVALGAWRSVARAAGATAGADENAPLPPFTGGAVGYWSYDFGRRFERLPAIARDDLALPDFVMGLYDIVGAFEHASGRAWLFATGLPFEGDAARVRAEERLGAFTRRIEKAPSTSALAPLDAGTAPRAAHSTFSADAYRRAIDAVREHILRGDIFQANLSQRWSVPLGFGATAAGVIARSLFDALAAVSPSPFAAFFDAGDHAIASASPELFLDVRGRRVTTRPIKGTRPRGMCRAEDDGLAAELVASAKDRAENVMIVDVLRNDLGRVCASGSVEVPELCALEAFPQVFHLTSTVTGTLREGIDAFDLLRAAFPGGSITGAPKIRAMEIIESLERVRRHIYTGSIGYADWNGAAAWNIAIRTALVTPGAIHFSAGGGITADSIPEAEYLETLHKAEGMRLALGRALGPVRLDGVARGAAA